MRSYYTCLAPYIYDFLILSYANFCVKARKIYKFLCNGGGTFQKSPPAGSDFALRATQGQSRLLKALTSRQKLYVLEEKGLRGTQAVKSFLESPYSLSKNFMWERATQALLNFLIKFSCTCGMLKRYFLSVS